jgi:hypothetical protein
MFSPTHYGIQDTTYKWIEAFPSNRTQQVLVEGATSDRANVVSGVPQEQYWVHNFSWHGTHVDSQ